MEIRKYFNNRLINTMLVIAGLVLCLEYGDKIVNVVNYMIALLFPFILAVSMAFVINVPMRYIEVNFFTNRRTGKKRKGARGLSILCTFLSIIGVIIIVVVMIVPEIGNTMGSLVENFSLFSKEMQENIDKIAVKYPELSGWLEKVDFSWIKISDEAISFLKSGVGGFLNSTVNVVGSIISGIFNFVIALAMAIYILVSKEELSRQAKRLCYSYMKVGRANRIIEITRLCNRVFSNFLSGQCVEACILGFMFFISMSLLDLPYALLIGVVIAFTALIPIFGAFLGCIIATFLIVVVNPIQAIVFLVLFIILQQIEENLVYPHVVGNSIGLPSLWVLVACTLGGSLMGIVGMLLFIPIASVLYTLLGEAVDKRLLKRGISPEKWEE